MSDPIKKLNRNAFNEKLIHRYVFERLYFSDKVTRNSLLPAKFHKEEINLIAPENSDLEKTYRADFTIYFKGLENGVPVEIKWEQKGLSKANQIEYLQKHDGFVITFDEGNKSTDRLSFLRINHEDFTLWLRENISKLTRESLIYQANIQDIGIGNQHWVVFLRGSAHANFYKMLRESPNAAFWAYTQNKHSLRNILNIEKGDYCLFIIGYASEGIGMSSNPSLECEIESWFITRIKEPYYMILKGKKGTFFEAGDIPINKRRWPHFVDFTIEERFEGTRVSFGKRGEFGEVFANSVNRGAGAPVPLFRSQLEQLTDKLRAITKAKNYQMKIL